MQCVGKWEKSAIVTVVSSITPAIEVSSLVRAAQEVFEYSKLIHQFKGGGMDGIAPEVPEEIGVFFEDLHVDAGASEQEAQHHAGRSATGYAARGLDGLGI